MSSAELLRVKERSKSRKKVNTIYANSINAYIVHYSCESFYQVPGQPPVGSSTRVTSLVARNLKTAQTKTWSIHKSAELNGQLPTLSSLATTTNTPAQVKSILDPLEKDMLDGYFNFISKCDSETQFIHWNMRDDNYGFSALEHRFRVLGGKPEIVLDSQKFDLARELVQIYGNKYVPHADSRGRKGRLLSLIELNEISDMDALPGADEAAAFLNGQYLNLQKSNLRKVDMINSIFDSVHGNRLKTNAKFMDRYGIHPIAALEVIKEHPIVTAFITVGALGAAASNWFKFSSFFGG